MKNVIKRTIALLLVIVMAVPYITVGTHAVSGGTVEFDDAHIDAYPTLSYDENTGEYGLEIELNAEFYESHTNTDNSRPARGYFTANYTGDYLVELWGGNGAAGPGAGGTGGKGGYIYGKIHLEAGDTLYYSLGGNGSQTYVSGQGGGANGGGGGGSAITYGVGGGGGYSALFLFEDEDYFKSNYLDANLKFVGDNISEFDRSTKYIMIAGGGGGGGAESPNSSVHRANGGNGGGMDSQKGTVAAGGTTVSGTFYAGGEGHSSGTSNEHIGHGGTTIPGKVATTWLSWSQGEKPNDWTGKYNPGAAPGAGGAGNLRGGGGGGGFCGGSGGVQESIISPNNIGGGGGGSSFTASTVLGLSDGEKQLLDGSDPNFEHTSGAVAITYLPDSGSHDTNHAKLANVNISFTISTYFRATAFNYSQATADPGNTHGTGYNFSYAEDANLNTVVTIYGVNLLPTHENLDGDLTVTLKVRPKAAFAGGNDVPILAGGNITITEADNPGSTASLKLNANNYHVNVPLHLDIDTLNHSYNVSKVLGPGDMHSGGYDTIRGLIEGGVAPGEGERKNYPAYDFITAMSDYKVDMDGDTEFTITTHVPVGITVTPYDDPNIKPAAGPPTQYETTITEDAVVTILAQHEGHINGTLVEFYKSVTPDPEREDIYTVSLQAKAKNDQTSHIPDPKTYGAGGGEHKIEHNGYYLIQAWGGTGGDGLTLTGNFLGWQNTQEGGTGGAGAYVWTWLELSEGDRILFNPVGSAGDPHDNSGEHGDPRGGGGGGYTLISIDYADAEKTDISNILIAGGGGGGGNAIVGQSISALGAAGEDGDPALGYAANLDDMSVFNSGAGGLGRKEGLATFYGGAAGTGAQSYYLTHGDLHYSFDDTVLDKISEDAFLALTGGAGLPAVVTKNDVDQWDYTVANPITTGSGAVTVTCLQLTDHDHVAKKLTGYDLDLEVSKYFTVITQDDKPVVTGTNNGADAAEKGMQSLIYTSAVLDGSTVKFTGIAPHDEGSTVADLGGNYTYHSEIDFTVTVEVMVKDGFLGGNDVPVLAAGEMRQTIIVDEGDDEDDPADDTVQDGHTAVPESVNDYVNIPLAVTESDLGTLTGKTYSTTVGASVTRSDIYTWDPAWVHPDDNGDASDDWTGDFVRKAEYLALAAGGDKFADMGAGGFTFDDNTEFLVTCGVEVAPPQKVTGENVVKATSIYLPTRTATVYVRPLVTYDITNLATSDSVGSFDPTADYEAFLTPATGYALPASVSVTYDADSTEVPHSYDSTTGRITISAGTTTGKGHITVSAEGILRQYTLTLVYETPGSNQPNYIRQTYSYGQAVTGIQYDPPAVTGYSFSWQWYTNKSDGVPNDGDPLEYMPARDVYVVGTYTPNEYKITVLYKYKEGDWPPGAETDEAGTYGPETYKFGESYSIKTTAKDGYATETPLIKGEVDEELLNGQRDGVYDPETKTVTFTVYYEKSSGRVRINYYDIETNEVLKAVNEEVTIPPEDDFVEKTFEFDQLTGYETVIYETVDDEEVLVQRDELTLNVTSDGAIIHVYYRPKKVTVNFWTDDPANGGELVTSRISYYNSEFGYHSVDGVRTWESIPTQVLREGYEYDGWYPQPEGIGERVYNYTIVPAPADWNDPVINLYVKWRTERFPVVVTHVYLNGAPAHETTYHEYDYNADYTVTPRTPDGYLPYTEKTEAELEAELEELGKTLDEAIADNTVVSHGGRYYYLTTELTGRMPNTTLSRTFYYIGKPYKLTINYHRYNNGGNLAATESAVYDLRFGDSYSYDSPTDGNYADHTCSMLTVAGVLDDLAEQAGGGRVENVHYYANAPTINVTVTWDNLTFTYDRGNWDPTTHTYADGTFEPSDGTTLEKGNQITVTSASSITIDAALTYTPVSPYETAAGYFTVAYDPESDRITKLSVEKNATGEAYLQLEGRLSDSISGTFTVGTVTVTITGGGKTGN